MAGMKDNFPFLPGHLVEFVDGGLKLKSDPTPASTESILILGTATDGPEGIPVDADPASAELLFGKSVLANGQPNGATLVAGMHESYAAGNRNVRLMRISGIKAKGEAVAASQSTGTVKVVTETVGVANGNLATTFTLANKNAAANSFKVFAGGVELTSTQFSHTADVDGTEKVEVLANVTNAKIDISITYKYTSGASTYEVTENGAVGVAGAFVPFVANGADQVFTLPHTPEALTLMINGKAASADAFTLVGKTLTVKAGAPAKDAILEASYSFVDTTLVEPKVAIESVFSGGVYNGVKRKVENILTPQGVVIGKQFVITKPAAKKATMTEKPLAYSSIDFPTLGDLAEAVNGDPRNNVVRLLVSKEFEGVLSNTLNIAADTLLNGGADEIKLSKERLFEKLSGVRNEVGQLVKLGAYQLLENYAVDYVVPQGVYFGDQLIGGKSFAYELALACAVMTHRNHVTHGVIATTSPNLPTLEEIDNHVEHLADELSMDFFMKDAEGNVIADAEGNKIDLGMYISVVAGPDVRLSNPRMGAYTSNSAAIYAGMITKLPVRSSPMNKDVPGIQGLRFMFSNAQLNKLTGARFVTYESKANGARVVVTDAPTAAQGESDYSELPSYRAVKVAADEVRAACDPFRGESNDVANRNAMSSAIQKRLDAMKGVGAIQGFEFQVISTLADQILGNAKIELTVVPPLILKKITTVVSLTAAL